MPEQPLVRTPMRMPAVSLPRLSISDLTRSAAAGVTVMTCGRGRRGRVAGLGASVTGAPVVVGVLIELSLKLLGSLAGLVLLRGLGAIVGDRRLDRILGQDRAVDLHRRQRQVLGDVCILHGLRLVDRRALS